MFHVLFPLQMGTCQVSCEGQCEAFGKLLEDRQAPPSYYHCNRRSIPVIMNVCVCMCWSESRLPVMILQLPSTLQLCRKKDESVWMHETLTLITWPYKRPCGTISRRRPGCIHFILITNKTVFSAHKNWRLLRTFT